MKKERILLIGGNFYPEPIGIGKYNGEMIEWLARQGHSCTVITTYPYYPQWKVLEKDKRRSFWFKKEIIPVTGAQRVKVIRCPHYVPKNPSGLYRLISEFSFFFSAYIVVLYFLFKKKFNYIITVAPPFEIGVLGILYKLIRGGKLIYHIQDLQIDAARDLGMIKQGMVIKMFLATERFILRHADWISSISKGMIEKVKNKCDKDVLLFPNWVDIKTFYPINNKAELKANHGFNPTDKVILYSGAIGHKQGLEAILYSAKILENIPDLKFGICGSGPYKGNLMRLKEELHLRNVVFLPLQPLSNFNSFLNIADAHLILQKKGASDLFLPSKLSAILSIGGVVIVTASAGTSLYEILSSHNTGILIEPENQEALINAIVNIESHYPEEKSRNARIYAENHLESNKILNEYFKKIFSYVKEDVREKIYKNVGAISLLSHLILCQ